MIFTKRQPARPLIACTPAIALFALASALSLASCAPRATVTLPANPAEQTGLAFGSTLTPASEALIAKLTGAGSGGVSLFDAPAITASLTAAGLSVESVSSANASSVAVSARVLKSDGLLMGAVSVKPAERSCRFTLDAKAVNAAITLMPASTRDYLDLLMAPVFTGDAMAAADYRDLIASAYGKTVAAELDASRFTLTIKSPSPVKTATIESAETATATKKGTEAVFSIPLIDLLVLEKPVTLEVTW